MIITGGRVAQSAGKSRQCDLKIERGRIVTHAANSTPRMDATGHVILPGLINAHDHLEFNLYPRLGRGPYPNSKVWSEESVAVIMPLMTVQTDWSSASCCQVWI